MTKKVFFSTMLFYLLGIGIAYGQMPGVMGPNSLVLILKNGTQQSKDLNMIRKLTFSSTDLILNYTNGMLDSFAGSTIQRMVFSTTNSFSDVATVDETQQVSLYPNPASSFIQLKNASTASGVAVTIFRADGAVALSTQLTSATDQISVSNLSKGLYLLKVNNQILKFIKL